MSGVWACIYKDMLLSIRQGNGCNGKSIAKPVLLLAIIQVISLKRLQLHHFLPIKFPILK